MQYHCNHSDIAFIPYLAVILTLTDYFSYRGYYSRKYEHDFYARKTYLNHVQHKVRNLLFKINPLYYRTRR